MGRGQRITNTPSILYFLVKCGLENVCTESLCCLGLNLAGCTRKPFIFQSIPPLFADREQRRFLAKFGSSLYRIFSHASGEHQSQKRKTDYELFLISALLHKLTEGIGKDKYIKNIPALCTNMDNILGCCKSVKYLKRRAYKVYTLMIIMQY